MTNTMSEKKIKNNLFMLAIVVAFAILLLILATIFMSFALYNVKNDSVNFRISAETNALSNNIRRHINADFRVLRTLASFLESANILNESNAIDTAKLKKALGETSFYSDFLAISCYSKEGNGARTIVETGEVTQINLKDSSYSVQKAVNQAFLGEYASSNFFFSNLFGRRISTHVVPVYHGSEVVGAITGSHGITEISKIIDGTSELDPDYNFFLLDKDANFLVVSEKNKFPQTIEFEERGEHLMLPVFPFEARQQIRQNQEGFFSFTYNGMECRGYIKPLNLNNMYILCVKTSLYSRTTTDYYVFLTRIIFGTMCVIMILVILGGYKLLNKYGRLLINIIYFDPLTGADNLNRFKNILSARCEKDNRDNLCVASLNVRQFKFINEIFGINGANRLLFIIKETLEENISASEFFCRENVDVFHLCLLENDHARIKERLENIISIIEHKLTKFYDYHLQMYAGVATFKNDRKTPVNVDEILIHVSMALSKARTDAANPVCFYDENLHEKEKTKNYIETHMERALIEGDFKLYLQPKIDLQTGELGGAEALVRWETSNGHMIFPDQFIPLFEQNGFCVKLDMFMFEQVCKLIREWMDADLEPLSVSVNQSKLMFFEPNYVNDISNIVAKYGIPPGIITLEILEQLALENVSEMNEKISLLRQEGFLVSMDDFGSGYSSFSSLGDLCIDELKLDRIFLQEANTKENWRTKIVIDQIVRMARRLHLSVIAEGVETEEDEILVKTLGCDYGQGYYYCRPIPAKEFTERYMKTTSSITKLDPYDL